MQVPFSKKYKLPSLPNTGYTMPDGTYQGPRITKAPVTVASHIKAYYWFCASLALLLVMGIIGAIALAIGVNMNTLCPASNDLMLWYFIFGLTDLASFGFILIIVLYSVNIFAQHYTTINPYLVYYNPQSDSTTPQPTYCNINVRNFAILLIILLAAGLTAPIIYLFIICKGKCYRKKRDKIVVAPAAP